MTSSIPLPVDYTTSPYTYSHDAVFQQMLLRGAHVFPPASTLLFRADNMTSRPITEPRTRRPSIVSSFTTRNQAYDSEVDDGYYADRDNEPKRLVAGEPQPSPHPTHYFEIKLCSHVGLPP